MDRNKKSLFIAKEFTQSAAVTCGSEQDEEMTQRRDEQRS